MAVVPYSVRAEKCGFGWGCEAACMVCGAHNSLKLIKHLDQFICDSETRCRNYDTALRNSYRNARALVG